MKYLVLFMESEDALPIDMLGRPLRASSKIPMRVEQLLATATLDEQKTVDCNLIEGYTTIDVQSHDDAMATVGSWRWCGEVKLLPLVNQAS